MLSTGDSEVVLNTRTQKCETAHNSSYMGCGLSWGDVMADSTSDPKVVQVHIKYSKTDQLGTGVHIYLGKTGGTLCPVAGVMAYMVIRGNGDGPFFVFKDGSPLTNPKFTERVRDGLQRAGLPYLNFAGHSFRIGAATAAAKAGIEDSTIQILGRWSSAAFLSYLCTPRKRLANLSATQLTHEINK